MTITDRRWYTAVNQSTPAGLTAFTAPLNYDHFGSLVTGSLQLVPAGVLADQRLDIRDVELTGYNADASTTSVLWMAVGTITAGVFSPWCEYTPPPPQSATVQAFTGHLRLQTPILINPGGLAADIVGGVLLSAAPADAGDVILTWRIRGYASGLNIQPEAVTGPEAYPYGPLSL